MIKEHFDLIIIGGGPAGYNAASRAAEGGLKTLLIEKRNLGGVCLNEGCIPTKAILYSAKIYNYANTGKAYGVTFDGAKLDHGAVIKRKNKVVKTLVGGVGASMKAAGVTVVDAEAEIAGKDGTKYLVKGGDNTYSCDKVLIASGSVASTPPITGLKENLDNSFAVTSREVLDLENVPKRMVVIGGGVIGLEIASYFSIAGSKVTIIEALDHIAGENDPEIVEMMQKDLEKQGVVFNLSSMVTEIKNGSVVFTNSDGKQNEISTDKVLLSIGRRAFTEKLGLDTIGVAVEKGAIITDDKMKTNQPNVYAAGDVNGKHLLAHVAYREGEVAINNMLGIEDTMRYDAIPAVVYTNPEVAAVGLSEAGAIADGYDVKIVKIPMRFSGRYLAENDRGNGICKMIFDKKNDRIIGATLYSNYASEVISTLSEAIALGLNVDTMKKVIFPHPSVAEIFRDAIFHY